MDFMIKRLNLEQYWKKHPNDVRKATMLAIIIKHSRVISYGYNKRKFHGHNRSGYKFTWHAEYSAISKAGIRAKGAEMLVLRIRKNGTFGDAEPCKACKYYIEKAGIKIVRYSI
jgi:deoxycytidylate deaminase